MRAIGLAAALSLGIAAAAAGQDTTKVKDTTKVRDTTKAQVVVAVKENKPGLLALAKIQPVDAQNMALTKFPDGKVVSGEITRKREGELLYIFVIERPGDHRKQKVMVSAIDGKLVNSIPIPKTKTDTMPYR